MSSPSTPDNTPRRVVMTRSFTVPAKSSPATNPRDPPAEIGAAEGIETLYTHPNANIVKFTTPGPGSPGGARSSSAALPWASPTERRMAAGQLEIYRVPGSVSFLHSGPLLHAIMPRSQCWCVDGVSKFALRVLSDTYYRIELPGETEEDLEEVEKFRRTLQKVLFYERTACPFARTFAVDLPEMPEVRKRRRKSTGPAKKWKLDRVWRPEGWVEPEGRGSEDSASSSGSSGGSEDESDSPEMGSSGNRTPVEAGVGELVGEAKELGVRARALAALRSASAPQAPTLQSPPPSRLRTRVDVDGTVEVTEPVETESRERETPKLRTFQAIPTDMPPSPPDSSVGLEYMEHRAQSEVGAADEQAPGGDRIVRNEKDDEQMARANENHEAEEQNSPPLIDEGEDEEGSDVREKTYGTEENTLTVVQSELAPSEGDYNGEEIPYEVEQIADSIEEPSEHSRPPSLPASSEEAWKESSQTSASEQQQEESIEDRPTTPRRRASSEDPYAAIHARILARRSIGGTTSFYPGNKSPTRQSTSSTSSSATITSNKSAVSRRSQSSHRQQAFASAMVKKACSVFLGPPAHLVAIMLRIAARFANGAFGVNSMFYVESALESPDKVPGTYHL